MSAVEQPATGPKALVGDEGWLFLENDKNDSVGQYTGRVRLGDRALRLWLDMFSDMAGLAAEIGFRHIHLIAPSKEAVYDQWYPHRALRSDQRPVDQLLAAAPAAAPILYPVPELRAAEGMRVFDKGDTHWNGYGAFLAAEAMLRRLGHEGAIAPDRFNFVERRKSGDLDSKLVPRRTEQRIHAEPRENSSEVTYDSEIANRGRTIVRVNPAAPLGRLVMFGDSFGWGLWPILGEAFQRFVFVHSTTPDRAILEEERPDVALTECTERFVIEGPMRLGSFEVTDVARRKFSQAAPEERERLRSLYAAKAATGREPYYSRLFLDAAT